ncbi:MAG: VanZ family protein [Bryobacteraceae bacterium]
MLPPARVRQFVRAIWFLCILIVIVGSLLPGSSLPMQLLGRLELSDKFEHFAAYAVLAFLPALHERRRLVLAAAVGALLLGVGLEYAQRYSGWRDFEVGDMVADAAGVGFGAAVGLLLRTTHFARSVFRGGSDK